MVKPAREVFRAFSVAGNPASGVHNPVKTDIIDLFEALGAAKGALVAKPTKAGLDAVVTADGTAGWVLSDPTGANNGYYIRVGAAWLKHRDFSDSFAMLEDITGTANAIAANVASGVNPASIVVFALPVALANTGATTLAIAGGAARALVDIDGNPLPAGALVAGRMVLLYDAGATYRLLTDFRAEAYADAAAASNTAAAAQAAAAAASAAAAQAAAALAASQQFLPLFPGRPGMGAITVPVGIDVITLHGYADATDGGGGQFVRLGAAPVVVKPWHLQTNGAWWLLKADPVYPAQLGAKMNGVDPDAVALQAWIDYAAEFDVDAVGSKGTSRLLEETLNVPTGVRIDGRRLLQIIRTGDTHQPVILSSGTSDISVRGLVFDYEGGTTSASSVTCQTGAATFTVGAGRGFTAGAFVIARPTASPVSYMIAQITSYSGTTLVVNVTTNTGVGSYSSWNIMTYTGSSGSGFTPAAIRLENVTDGDVGNNDIAGKYFIGIGLKNPAGVSVVGNRITGVSDRGIENNATAGATDDNEIVGNIINGNEWTLYGINSSGTTGVQTGLRVQNNSVSGVLAQGVSCNGQIFNAVVSGNSITMATSGGGASGVGIFFQSLGSASPFGGVVAGNNISGGFYGVYMLNAIDFVVDGNSVQLTGADGILAQSTGPSVCGYVGTVNSNNVRNCVGSGIYLLAGDSGTLGSVIVSGNATKANGGHGVKTSSSTTGCVIGPNTHYGNTAGATSIAGTGHTVI